MAEDWFEKYKDKYQGYEYLVGFAENVIQAGSPKAFMSVKQACKEIHNSKNITEAQRTALLKSYLPGLIGICKQMNRDCSRCEINTSQK